MPELGLVSAEVRLFDRSLLNSDDDAPRSYGFFVLVRGRLINPVDARLFLSDPSFGTFYRCQFVIRADGLDEDLLADRERLQSNTPRARELAVIQRALYRAARAELERRDERTEQQQRSESLLPVESSVHFREPLTALLLLHDSVQLHPVDLAKARIERAALSEASPLAILGGDGLLKVNLDHPLFASIQKRLGEGKVAKDALQVFDVIAVSERLLEGYLLDLGILDEQIKRILQWRDGLFRAIAKKFGSVSFEEVVREVRETSFGGREPFEKALIKLFGLMGFEARHFGQSGSNDGLVVAPIGQEEFKFTVEAKGSNGAVANDEADIADAAAHRDAVGASFAIIAAREFGGFKRPRPEGPEILRACESTRGVSIVTIDVLIELFEAVREFGYPLATLLPVLQEVESPESKLERVRAMRKPTENFDFRGVLDAIWERQQGEASGDLVSYRTVWQSGTNRWGVATIEEFERRLLGMAAFSELLRVLPGEKVVTLLQSPAIVAQQIQRAIDARDSLH